MGWLCRRCCRNIGVNFYFLMLFRQILIGRTLGEETGEGFITGRVNGISTAAERYAILL